MTENHDERKDFYERELWPQLNPGKVLIDKAEEAQKQGKLVDAILYLEGALLVDPKNKEAQEKLREFKKGEHQELKELGRVSKAEQPFVLPFTLFKDNKREHEIITAEELSLTGKKTKILRQPGDYQLVDSEGRVVLPRELLTPKQDTLPQEDSLRRHFRRKQSLNLSVRKAPK